MKICSSCGKPDKIWAVGVEWPEDCEPSVQVCIKCVKKGLEFLDEKALKTLYKVDNFYAVKICIPLKVSLSEDA